MGDFNLKSECEKEKKKIHGIFTNFNIHIQNSTFQRGPHVSSLDHILIRKDFGQKFKCSSFKNIYSDHSSINFRYINIYIYILYQLFLLGWQSVIQQKKLFFMTQHLTSTKKIMQQRSKKVSTLEKLKTTTSQS